MFFFFFRFAFFAFALLCSALLAITALCSFVALGLNHLFSFILVAFVFGFPFLPCKVGWSGGCARDAAPLMRAARRPA
jgi:hypothetical protein